MINFLLLCGCGGMADAADSKSAAHKACGFKSRHPHFLFNNNYYLVLDNLNLENSNLSFFYSSLLEFSVIEKYSRNFIFKLKEHGKVILKNNAITTCIQYFA